MINGSTKIVGLIGHPVEHSFSPPILKNWGWTMLMFHLMFVLKT